MEKVVFLDRDGTINIEKNYLHKIEDFEWEKEAKKAIKIFNDLGYKVIVITNQSGIARGYYTEEDVIKLHYYMNKELKRNNTKIDKYYYCPHHKDGKGKYKKECLNRKPEIGFFEKIQKEFKVDLRNSIIVGDKLSDLEAGIRIGIKPFLVKTGHGKENIEKVYFKAEIERSLIEVAEKIKKMYGCNNTKIML